MPAVTVIMPVYNTAIYLPQAIESILNQTFSDFELLIIDDASTDQSVDIIRQYKDSRIHYIRNSENQGISETRNRGIDLARSEYIALMDSDDIAPSARLEKEVAFMNENRDIDVVGGHLLEIDHNGKDRNKKWTVSLNPDYIKAYLLLGNTVANGSAMFRKSFVDRYKIRFSKASRGAEDYRFWVDCSLHGRIANLDEVMLYWRTGHYSETSLVKANRSREREEALTRAYALHSSGFRLSDQDLSVLNEVFKEDGIINNMEELQLLYTVLRKISRQAKELQLCNSNEIVTMCRKRFGEKVGKAYFLW